MVVKKSSVKKNSKLDNLTPFEPNKDKAGGRTEGTPNKSTAYKEAMAAVLRISGGEAVLKEEVVSVFLAMIEKAKAGDTSAAKIILDRMMPIIKSTKVKTGIRKIRTLEELSDAYDLILVKVDDQELSLEEAESVCSMLERKAKVFEFAQLKKENEELRAYHEIIRAQIKS